jgi:anti-sigma factor RsiW
MDHQEYIERYLSADIDGELSAEEQREVAAHLAGCSRCRAARAAELETKRLIRERLSIAPAPAALRERIVAALDTIRDAPVQERRLSFRCPAVRVSIGVAAALAAAIVVFIATRPPANPEFDAAIAAYEKAQQQFTPNIPSHTVDDMAVSLAAQFGLPFIWDFSSIGLSLAGARIDHTSERRPVAEAYYKGSVGSLLCIMRREDAVLDFPPDGRVIKGVHVYKYRGFSIAETQYNTVFCVMVTRLSADQLRPALSLGEARG